VRHIFSLCCLLLFTSCGRCGFGSYYTQGIRHYQGDGTISDNSQPSGLFGTRGYIVEFPKFDLGSRYERQFRLSHLPTLGSAAAEIRFVVEEPLDMTRVDELRASAVTGAVTVKLFDSAGRQVTGYSAKLSDLIWSGPVHDHVGYALYELDHSEFVPHTDETYTLSVSYSPESTLRSKTGYFYVWCGCGGS
jgi:hypothetical protein